MEGKITWITTKTKYLGDNDNRQSAAIRHSRLLIAPVQRERQWNASGKYERRQTQGGYNEEAGEKEFSLHRDTARRESTRPAAERSVKSVCISTLSDFFAIVAIHGTGATGEKYSSPFSRNRSRLLSSRNAKSNCAFCLM